jgi:hypothetical protein
MKLDLRLVVLWLFILPALAWGQGLYEHAESGFRFPAHLGAFERTSVHRFDEPKLGVQIGYVAPGLGRLDVYVFNYGFSEIPKGIKSDLVRTAYSSADRDVQSLAKSGQYLELERVIPLGGVMALSTDDTEFYVASYKLRPNRANADPLLSWLLVTGLRNQFVKIRYSHLASEEQKGRAELDRLVAAFLATNKD